MTFMNDVTLSALQKRTVAWMLRQEHGPLKGGAVGLKPGLGKTFCALFLTNATTANNVQDLYIVPPSLLYQWRAESNRLKDTNKIVFLSYYALLYLPEDSSIWSQVWNRIVLDEAHLIRNPNTKLHQAVIRLQAIYRWALSGTFLVNSSKDLVGIAHFLRHPYATSWQKLCRVSNTFLFLSTDEDRLAIGLHPVQAEIRWLVANSQEQSMLQVVFEKVRQTVKRNPDCLMKSMHFLRMMTSRIATKMKDVGSLIFSLQTSNKAQKILIFANYVATLKYLQKFLLQNYQQESLLFIGEMSAKERQRAIDEFMQPTTQKTILLVGYGCGNAGLNLQVANTVILYEGAWNTSVEEQAIARSSRRNQTNTVFVYRILLRRTIEEHIYNLVSKKNHAIKKMLTHTEIKQILHLSKQ